MLRIRNRDHGRCEKSPRAFTLVELLVVIVILSLLISIVTPHIQAARDEALRTKCRAKLKSLYDAAAAYGGDNRNRVPLVHHADFATTGKILRGGGEFAEKYMQQSWKVTGKYADMEKKDNVFQCPSALNHWDYHPKTRGTNYRLSGFALGLGGAWDSGSRPAHLPALYPKMTAIRGLAQARANSKVSGSQDHPAGRVCMAMDWIWSPDGSGLPDDFQEDRGMSLRNHRKGANVLYGSGDVQWVSATSMRIHPRANMVPKGTYGFVESGEEYTYVYTPGNQTVGPNNNGIKVRSPNKIPNHAGKVTNGWGDTWPGHGVFGLVSD